MSSRIQRAPVAAASSATEAVICSPLRHLDAEAISQAARAETRNREVHLPPVSVYRWWARRTEAVNGAIIDAYASDHPGRLLIADPFAGGGVIPLAAVLRGHRVYAQDLNPWATEGLVAMLGLPTAPALKEATAGLHDQAEATIRQAYQTTFSDGESAEIAHTLRVASACCSHCGERGRLFPHALVSLKVRRERGIPDAFLACPAGHVFEGKEGAVTDCPVCDRHTDPAVDYTAGRVVCCPSCGHKDRLEARATGGQWRWEPALVERSKGRRRELAIPRPDEVSRAESADWDPRLCLSTIPDGQETKVLLRHGFGSWHDLYPRRQRVVIERLLAFSEEVADDAKVLNALRLAIIGSAEMAGHLSRWDRYYLKSYESMAGHRFNFSTLVAEPNVWGASASGRGTVRRRLASFAKIADWMHARLGRTLDAQIWPASMACPPTVGRDDDVRVVEGSSERMLLEDLSVDLVLTDPPYHDDVHYDELSLPLRSWSQLSVEHLDASASVNHAIGHNTGADQYEALLSRIFTEARRTLRDDGHLIFSYANREPEAWAALLAALQAAGLRACGYLIVHSENETDVAKRGVRACTLDLILDLVPVSSLALVRWSPRSLSGGDEEQFLGTVADAFLQVGGLPEGWRPALVADLRALPFLGGAGSSSTSGGPFPDQSRPA